MVKLKLNMKKGVGNNQINAEFTFLEDLCHCGFVDFIE